MRAFELDYKTVITPSEPLTQAERVPPRNFGKPPTANGDGFGKFFRYEYTASIDFDDHPVPLHEQNMSFILPRYKVVDNISATPTIRISEHIIEDTLP